MIAASLTISFMTTTTTTTTITNTTPPSASATWAELKQTFQGPLSLPVQTFEL